jgi:hypothetical protein
MRDIIWYKQMGDSKVRIIQIDPADCLVECSQHPNAKPHGDIHWEAADDALAAQVYLTAYLEARTVLAEITGKATAALTGLG